MKLIRCRSISITLRVLIILVLFLSCKREGPIPEVKPLLKTNQVNLNAGSDGGITVTGEFILSGSYRSIEYGFYFDKDASFKNPIIITSGNDAEPGKFELTAQIALNPDIKYYVRTWAKTANYEVFGNTIIFQSNGLSVPVIERIVPEIALWGDTIKIIGKNFDYFGKENKVKFNNVLSVKTWDKQDTIWAIVPFVPDVQNNKVAINVAVFNNLTQKGSQLMIAEPVILGISATEGKYPDTIVVVGNNFSRFASKVRINGLAISITDMGKSWFSFVIPYLKNDQTIKVELISLNKNYTITESFHYRAQQIFSELKAAWIGDTIKLYGKNIEFNRILLDIKSGDQSLKVTQRWKDSLSFILWGKYDASLFNLDLKFGKKDTAESPVPIFSTVDQLVVPHRDPLLVGLGKKEFVYCEDISWKGKGVYYNILNQGYLIRSVDGSFNSSYYGFFSHTFYSQKLVPGDYYLQLYSFDRLSNSVLFTVKAPIIENVLPTSFNRDDVVQITGKNLPRFSDFQFTHIQSGRTFILNNEDYGSNIQKVNPAGLIGNGNYRLEIQIGGKSFKYPGILQFNDYLSYLLKTKDPFVTGMTSGNGFVCNNKLYVLDYRMSTVDLETGKVLIRNRHYDYVDHPVFVGKKIYANIMKGINRVVASFNETSEDWEELNNEGFSNSEDFRVIGVFNNLLIGITYDGKVFQYDKKWSLLATLQDSNPIFIYANYMFSRNGNLYLFRSLDSKIIVVSTSDWKIKKQIKMPDDYFRFSGYEFELNGEIYISGKPDVLSNYYNLFKFTADESFEPVTPQKMKFDVLSQFCPDGKGGVYLVDKEYIYKINMK